MIGHILVPLDGTSLAETILPLALRIARKTQATLELITIVHRTNLLGPLASEVAAYDYLDRVRETLTDPDLEERLPPEYVKIKVAYGLPGEETGEHSEFEQANLILMTTHGRTPGSRLVLGNLASKLLQRNCGPLILFKAGPDLDDQTLAQSLHQPGPWLKTRLANRVILPLDGSEAAESAMPQAIELTRELGAELHLLAVIEPSILIPPLSEGSDTLMAASNPEHEQMHRLAEARLYLENIARKLYSTGLPIRVAVEQGYAAEAIHSFAQRRNATVVVMATRSVGPHHRFRLGSIADQVLLQGGIPVLIVPNVQVQPYVNLSDSIYQQRVL